jgi:hypothetical protein
MLRRRLTVNKLRYKNHLGFAPRPVRVFKLVRKCVEFVGRFNDKCILLEQPDDFIAKLSYSVCENERVCLWLHALSYDKRGSSVI